VINRLTALVSLLVLVDTIFYSALTPLVPHYAVAAGFGTAGVGVLVAAYPAGTLVASLPSGVFFDRFGARRTLLLAMVLMSVSTFTFGWSSEPGVLIVARFVQGIGGSFAWTAGLASLAATAPAEQRGRYIGVAFSAAVAGAILGPVLGAIAAHLGTGPVFSAAAVLAAVILCFQGMLPASADRQAVSLREVVDVARHPGIARGLWLTTLAGIGLGTLGVLGPLRLSSLGASAGLIAAAFVAAGLFEAVLSPLVGRLSDRRGPRYPVSRSLAVCIVASVVIPFVSRTDLALVVVGLASMGFGTLFTPGAAMISHGGDERGTQFGLIFGLANLVWACGQGVASGISGVVADATSDKVPFIVVAVICVISLVGNHPRVASAVSQE
jgi:MFS family permease